MKIKKANGKKFWALILSVVMFIGLLPQMTMPVQAVGEVYAVFKSDGKVYETNSDNTVPTGIVIDKSTVTNLFVADDVTTIGNQAFGWCTSLTTVEMPKVKTIDKEAFYGCSALTTVEMPEVTSVGDLAFFSCQKLVNIQIPKVISIGIASFKYCTALTNATMQIVNTINNEAFQGCTVLTNLTVGAIPPTVTNVNAFDGCPAITTLTIDGGTAEAINAYKAVTDGNTTDNLWYGWTLPAPPVYGVLKSDGILYRTNSDNTVPTGTVLDKSTVTILFVADDVTTIGVGRFTNSASLKTVKMPNVESVGNDAFTFCKALTIVEMPKVTTIGSKSFYRCEALTTIDIPVVTSLGDYAFYGCKVLTTAKMLEVKVLSNFSFWNCPALTTVEIPKVTSVGEDAFKDCKLLTIAEMPEVTLISKGAFSNCGSLTAVKMPKVKSIGMFAFQNCLKLETLEMKEVITVGSNAFIQCVALTAVEMPYVQQIDSSAFFGCKNLKTVAMPNVQTINAGAFSKCITLAKVEVPEVTVIAITAFRECVALETVVMPKIGTIGDWAFDGCTLLANITVGATPPKVSNINAFTNCPAKTTLTIDGVNTADAINAYKAAADGVITDNLWYGWTLPVSVTPTLPTSLDISKGSITVLDGTNSDTIKVTYNDGTTEKTIDNLPVNTEIIITGTTTSNTIIVNTVARLADNTTTKTVNITLKDMNINVISIDKKSAFDIQGISVVNLNLDGNNTLKSGSNQAGLQVQRKDGQAATVTINGTGALNATGYLGGAGIGSGVNYPGGNINISGANVTATGGQSGAGIGGGTNSAGGDIIISGGTVTTTGGDSGAGIGGGHNGPSGNITISGATIIATGGENASGIGRGGSFSDIILSGYVKIDDTANIIAVSTGAKYAVDGNIEGKMLIATYKNRINANTSTTLRDTSGNDLSIPVTYTPTSSYQSIAFSGLKNNAFTLYKGDTQQVHVTFVQNKIFEVSVEGVTRFSNVQDYVAPPTTYTVTYNKNNGTGTMVPQSFTPGTPQHLTANIFTRTGYTYVGWNTLASGLGTSYADSASYTATASITLYAQWEEITPPQTNTVTVNSGTGSGIFSAGSTVTITANAPQAGKQFKAWTVVSGGITLANSTDASTTFKMPTGAVVVTATYEDIPSIPGYDVSGEVEDDNNNNLADVTVKLMKGYTKVGETTTATNGTFTIANIPNGTYNLVVSKDGIIVTTIVVISGKDYATGTITLPSGKTNSVVEVKPNTPQIVVGNLEQQFIQADKDVVTGGGSVEIKLVAEGKTASTAPNAGEITATASSNGKTVGQFIDISVFKTTTPFSGSPATTAIGELPTLVVVYIPLDTVLQGKSDYVIYRYHGSAVNAITTVANADGEKIELVDSGATIKLTTKKFSTYAVAYKNTTSGGGATGGGSTTGTSEIEKLIIDLPTVDEFKETNLPEFEIIEIEYNKLTNDEKSVIDVTLHNKYKAIAKLAETMRKVVVKPEIVKPLPTKPATNPKTGDSVPLALPMMATIGLALMALRLYLKNKGKQQ